MIIVKTKIKEIVGNLNISSDLAEALNKEVERMLLKAVERAKENGRKTVMAKDL